MNMGTAMEVTVGWVIYTLFGVPFHMFIIYKFAARITGTAVDVTVGDKC